MKDEIEPAQVPLCDPADQAAERDADMPPAMPVAMVGFPAVGGAIHAAAGGLARPTEGMGIMMGGGGMFGAVGPLTDEGTDASLADQVEAVLTENAARDGQNVSFSLDDEGGVTLTGTVPSEHERQSLETSVRRIGGIVHVENRLRVA